MSRNILMTGITGLIGSDVAARLLLDDPEVEIRAIVRNSEHANFDRRLENALRFVLKEADFGMVRQRVRALRGDIALPGLGLAEGVVDSLVEWTDEIIHCAAATAFDLPLEEAWMTNVDPTRELITFAHRVQVRRGLRRFAHLSTAYVAGDRSGLILENELDKNQGFVNTYEQTKFEAERLFVRERERLPVLIFRPCATIGDPETGRTPTFNVIYYPLKLLSRNLLPALPSSPKVPTDLVPVNYVGSAIVHILRNEKAIGKTFHLTAGKRLNTIGEIAELAVKYVNKIRLERGEKEVRPVRFVPRSLYRYAAAPLLRLLLRGHARQTFNKLEIYLPYLYYIKNFDTAETERFLAGTGIAVPSLRDYFERICRYAIESDWGRKREPGSPQAVSG